MIALINIGLIKSQSITITARKMTDCRCVPGVPVQRDTVQWGLTPCPPHFHTVDWSHPHTTGRLKKRVFSEIRLLGPFKASIHSTKQINYFFYPKLWYPGVWFPVVYSISLLSCMVKYKDASKDKSNLMPLNTLFFRRPVVITHVVGIHRFAVNIIFVCMAIQWFPCYFTLWYLAWQIHIVSLEYCMVSSII